MPLINESSTREYLEEFQSSHKDRTGPLRSQFNDLLLRAELGRQDEEKPFPMSLGALLLKKKEHEQLGEEIEILIEATKKVRKLVLKGDERVTNVVRLSPGEERLIQSEQDHIDLDTHGVLRVDVFPTSDGPRIAEINSDNPDAILIMNAILPDFLGTILLHSWQERIQQPVSPGDLLLRSMHHICGEERKSVGVIGPKDRWFIGEQNKTVEFLGQQGIDTTVATPEELTFENGKATAKGKHIDTIRRVAEIGHFAKHIDKLDGLLQAVSSGSVCVLNSFSDRLLGHKSQFHIFTDEAFADLFTAEEKAILKKLIPWTRVCTTEKFTFKGEETTLEACLQEQKDELVLKPAGGSEAEGIHIGSEESDKEWQAASEKALENPEEWIVQERIHMKPAPVLIDNEDGTTSTEDATTDISIHVFQTGNGFEVGHMMSRYAFNPINNIISGGGFLLPLVLSE